MTEDLEKAKEQIVEWQKEAFSREGKEWAKFVERVWITSALGQLAAVAEVIGWDKLNEILVGFWKKRAMERIPAQIESRGGIGKGSCLDVARVTVGNAASPMGYEPLEMNEKRFWVRIHDCGEGEVIRDAGLAGKIFWPCVHFWRATQGSLINPKIKCKSIKGVCVGDDYCEFDWTLED